MLESKKHSETGVFGASPSASLSIPTPQLSGFNLSGSTRYQQKGQEKPVNQGGTTAICRLWTDCLFIGKGTYERR
jgi:hypothetical protein